jgi:hypothetical protein
LIQASSRSQARIAATDWVALKPDVISAVVDDEVVALDAAQGTCFGLNAVGSRIWGLIAAPTQVSAICADLLDEFEVEADVCEKQVLELLESLRAEGLIVVRPAGAAPAGS